MSACMAYSPFASTAQNPCAWGQKVNRYNMGCYKPVFSPASINRQRQTFRQHTLMLHQHDLPVTSACIFSFPYFRLSVINSLFIPPVFGSSLVSSVGICRIIGSEKDLKVLLQARGVHRSREAYGRHVTCRAKTAKSASRRSVRNVAYHVD